MLSERVQGIGGCQSGNGWLEYSGVQAYSGSVQHIEAYEERRRVYCSQLEVLAEALGRLADNGLSPKIVTGGGTDTAAIDLVMRVFTEMQFGSYIFMDVEYGRVQICEAEKNSFKPSLFLRTAVVSANVVGQAIMNAGFKSLATDGPTPTIRQVAEGIEGGSYQFFGDEYGLVRGLPPKR